MDFQQPQTNRGMHPGVTMMYLILKSAPVVFYVLGGLFIKSYSVFVPVMTILAAMDFWYTKNVAGRLLVGLYWTRVIKDKNEEFEYKSLGDETKNNKCDDFVFWWGQYISTICWVVFLILKSFTTQFFVVLIPAVLNVYDLYAYYQCSREKQNQANAFLNQKKQEATQAGMNFALQEGLKQKGLAN